MKRLMICLTILLLILSTAVIESTNIINSTYIFSDLASVYSKWRHLTYHPDVITVSKKSPGHSEFTVSGPFKFKDFVKFGDAAENTRLLYPSFSENRCAVDLFYVMLHLKSQWALQMFDADGKLPSGLFHGNFLWMGNYRECLETYAPPETNSSFGNFHGQYCVALWDIQLPPNMPLNQLPLKTGICLPISCNESDVEMNMKSILHMLGRIPFIKKYSSQLSLNTLTCKTQHQNLDRPAKIFLLYTSIIGLIMLCGSVITAVKYFKPVEKNKMVLPQIHKYLYNGSVFEEGPIIRRDSSTDDDELLPVGDNDTVHEWNHLAGDQGNKVSFCQRYLFAKPGCCFRLLSSIKNLLLCFCVFTNGAKILNTKVTEDQLLCIHGIRVLSMTWIILGHTYVHCINVVENVSETLKDMDNVPFQIIMQGTFSVDSFFLLSGFLLTYLFLKEADKREGKINHLYLFIHRYWRLTPVYAVLLAYNTVAFKYTGSGPFWGDVSDIAVCKKNWWWNILYINNFLKIDTMCAAWTWYLANDMQFFVISFLFLYALWRWPKIGLSLVSSILLGSWVTTWIISDNNKVMPMFIDFARAKNYTSYQEELFHAWDLIYSKPYCRIGPYLIGVLMAYILYKIGEKKKFLCVWQQIFGWTIAAFCSLSVIYGLYHLKFYNQVMSNFYNALARSSFSLGLSWVIFVCLTGHGGFINKILSLKFWIPLSRLTYCAYLFHPVIMSWYFQSLHAPLYFTHQTMVMCFFAFLFMSYAIGFILSIAFESPMMSLEKVLFKKS